jgi:hypothetical protein
MVGSAGNVGVGVIAGVLPQRRLHVTQDSATTNAVTYVERLTSTTSGAAATGIGAGVEFEIECASANRVGATIEAAAQTVTNAAEIIALNARQMAAGALQEAFGLSFLVRSLSANVAYSNVNTVQPWFPTTGAISLEAASYEFEGLLMQTPGITSHTVALSFTGTAVLASIGYLAFFAPTVLNTTLAAGSNTTMVAVATATVVTPAITTAGTVIQVRGIVRVTTAGTLIPNITFSAAPGAGNNLANSFFKLRKIGSNSNVSQGNWA